MSDLKIIKLDLPANKYSKKCPYAMSPIGITIHNTYNSAPAKNEISYMQGNNNSVSFHYCVDEIQAIQGLPLNRNGWHAGDGQGTGNRKTIGIEIARSQSDLATYRKAEDNAAKLTALLCKQYGWTIKNVYKHQDWSGKYCPHRMLDLKGWQAFRNKVASYMQDGKTKIQKPAGGNFVVRVICDELNRRTGAGVANKILGTLKKGDAYTIIETAGNWGKLKYDLGWINITKPYAERI